MKKLSLVILLTITQINFCMEKPKLKVATAKLVEINDLKDVEKFAGCIVVYKTSSYDFGTQCCRCYQINPKNSCLYGYISHEKHEWESGIGYRLYKLMEFYTLGGNCPLINSEIKRKYLYMGLATEQEVVEIKNAINSSKAKFEFDEGDWKDYLQKYSKKLLAIKTECIEHLARFLSTGQKRDQSKNYGPFPVDIAYLIAKFRYNLK